MALIPFQKFQSKAQDLNRLQTNIDMFSRSLIDIPILNGVLLENIVLSTTAAQIQHKLDRNYRGWIVVKQNANATIYSTSSTLSQQFLTLTASAAVTVTLWVF